MPFVRGTEAQWIDFQNIREIKKAYASVLYHEIRKKLGMTLFHLNLIRLFPHEKTFVKGLTGLLKPLRRLS